MGEERAQNEAQTKLNKKLAASIQAAAKKGAEMTGQQPVPPQESPPSQYPSKPQKLQSLKELPRASLSPSPARGKGTLNTRGRGLARGTYDPSR